VANLATLPVYRCFASASCHISLIVFSVFLPLGQFSERVLARNFRRGMSKLFPFTTMPNMSWNKFENKILFFRKESQYFRCVAALFFCYIEYLNDPTLNMKVLSDQFPVLYTSRLQLIEINHSHQPDLFYLLTDKRVTEYYHVIPLQEVADVRKVVDFLHQRFIDKEGIRWGIALENKEELIGMIGFNSFVPGHKGVLVFALVQEYWGKGYMAEAIAAVTAYGFSTLELKRIEAEVLPGNKGSEKVLEKTGFRHEGLLQQWMLWDNKAFDVNMYALLPPRL